MVEEKKMWHRVCLKTSFFTLLHGIGAVAWRFQRTMMCNILVVGAQLYWQQIQFSQWGTWVKLPSVLLSNSVCGTTHSVGDHLYLPVKGTVLGNTQKCSADKREDKYHSNVCIINMMLQPGDSLLNVAYSIFYAASGGTTYCSGKYRGLVTCIKQLK